ncbi:hypothetical protein ACM66B_001066 [Microbotryomycetes sp. NB124-2]
MRDRATRRGNWPLLAVAVAAVACCSSTSVVALSLPPYEAEPYLAWPPKARSNGAFLLDKHGTIGPDTTLRFDTTPPIAPVNPVPAYDRHPLALPPMQQQRVGRRSKRDVIAESDAPFPPSRYININNLTSIALVAQAAVARMQTWYEDAVYEWSGWWQVPVVGMAYTALDFALGNNVNELLIKDLLISNDDLGWMIDKYIDDQSWWAMFALRAHQLYTNQTWFDLVMAIEYNNTLYWDDTCGGGVLWLTYRPMIKNTITNGLHFSILTRLYRYTGDGNYYQKAMQTLNWWLGWAFDPSNGRVFDTITGPDCERTGEGWWTYNSGAFLFGLADLWYTTGDEKILDLGRTIAYAAMRDFSDPATGVLVESCEDDPPPAPDKPPACQQDETLFKGIFMLALSELYLARPDENIYNFINTQMLSNVFNNVDDSWLFGLWWRGPWNETTAGPKTQMNALCAIAAAAVVNSDLLTRAGRNTTVPAMLQVGVPVNSTATGDAGTIARSTSHGVDPNAASAQAPPFLLLATFFTAIAATAVLSLT